MTFTDDFANLSIAPTTAHLTGAFQMLGIHSDTGHDDFAMTSQEQADLVAHDVEHHHAIDDYFDVLVTLMHNPLIDDTSLMQSG